MTILYDYWRSSAAYRLRIALAHPGEAHDSVAVGLLTGAHRGAQICSAVRRALSRRWTSTDSG